MIRKPEPRGAFQQLVADLAKFRSQRKPKAFISAGSKLAQLRMSISSYSRKPK